MVKKEKKKILYLALDTNALAVHQRPHCTEFTHGQHSYRHFQIYRLLYLLLLSCTLSSDEFRLAPAAACRSGLEPEPDKRIHQYQRVKQAVRCEVTTDPYG